MRTLRLVAVAGIVTAGVVTLGGCSVVDAVIWGPGGAAVIRSTESLVQDMSSGDASDLICDDAVADFGAAEDWQGLSAGEPERFHADYWDEQAPLDPQWNINLEGLPEGAVPGDEFPGAIFYRQTDEGLCVIDVAWATLESQG